MANTDESRTTDLLLALCHPLRREILRTLSDDTPRSPSELAESLDLPLSHLSYHVRVLVSRGAVRLVRTAPARGSTQHFYLTSIEAEWARTVLADDQARPRRRGTAKKKS